MESFREAAVCVVCNSRIEVKNPSPFQNSNNFDVNLSSTLKSTFCKYFHLTNTPNLQTHLLQFCPKCTQFVEQLSILNGKFEEIRKEIEVMLVKITSSILISVECEKNNNINSSTTTFHHDGEDNAENEVRYEIDENTINCRRLIHKRFNPQIFLSKCSSRHHQSKTTSPAIKRKQKRIEKNTTKEIENTGDFFVNAHPIEIEHVKQESDFGFDLLSTMRGSSMSKGCDDQTTYGQLDLRFDADDANDMMGFDDGEFIDFHHDDNEDEEGKEKNQENCTSHNQNKVQFSEIECEKIRKRKRYRSSDSEFSAPESGSESEGEESNIQLKSKDSMPISEKILTSKKIEKCDDVNHASGFIYGKTYKFCFTDNEEKLKCATCEKLFSINRRGVKNPAERLIRHIRVDHMGKPRREKKQKPSLDERYPVGGKFMFLKKYPFERLETGFQCGECPKLTLSLNGIQGHISKWHCTGNLTCSKCGHRCATKTVLKGHKCREEQQQNASSLEIEPGKWLYAGKWPYEKIGETSFRCNTCLAQRNCRKQIVSHVRNSHEISVFFQCELCGTSLASARCLERHKLTHTEQRDELCAECGKAFKTKASLYTHVQGVHVKKPKAVGSFSCDRCGKCLKTVFLLQKHLANHEMKQLQSFECSSCQKSFPTRRGVQKHEDRCLKIYKYLCEVCDKGFVVKWQFERHKLTTVHLQKEADIFHEELVNFTAV